MIKDFNYKMFSLIILELQTKGYLELLKKRAGRRFLSLIWYIASFVEYILSFL